MRAHYVPLLLGWTSACCRTTRAARSRPRYRADLRHRGAGFFGLDNLTFGTDIEVSRLVALAQAAPGVDSVDVTRLERLGEGDGGGSARGYLRLGRLEIARLDNDPSEPEHGQLQFEIGGGR